MSRNKRPTINEGSIAKKCPKVLMLGKKALDSRKICIHFKSKGNLKIIRPD